MSSQPGDRVADDRQPGSSCADMSNLTLGRRVPG